MTVWLREPTSTLGSCCPESEGVSLGLSSEDSGDALFLGSFSSGTIEDYLGFTDPFGREATETFGGGSS